MLSSADGLPFGRARSCCGGVLVYAGVHVYMRLVANARYACMHVCSVQRPVAIVMHLLASALLAHASAASHHMLFVAGVVPTCRPVRD